MSEKTNIATLDYLNEYDPAIGNAMTDELKRQRRNLELIASENIVSPAVMAAMGSLLTNKYAEGYPGKRYYGGCQCVDVVEEIARQRACELFGAEHANVQPHSGAQANTAVYFAMLNPGDTVMGMNLNEGGHLTHGSPVNISGKYFNFVPYGVDPETHRIDYDKVLEIAKECKPKMIVAGASAYPRIIDFAKLREIADAVGAYLMVDMAHIAGIVWWAICLPFLINSNWRATGANFVFGLAWAHLMGEIIIKHIVKRVRPCHTLDDDEQLIDGIFAPCPLDVGLMSAPVAINRMF